MQDVGMEQITEYQQYLSFFCTSVLCFENKQIKHKGSR